MLHKKINPLWPVVIILAVTLIILFSEYRFEVKRVHGYIEQTNSLMDMMDNK